MSFMESIKESFKYACTPQAGNAPEKPQYHPTPKKQDTIEKRELASTDNNRKVIIKTYTGNQEFATYLFQSDSAKMATNGYFPTSQSWAPGSYGCGSFIFALLLCIIVVGVLVFIYMLLVKPDGTLTVTYEYREAVPNISPPAEEKTCPKCAEQVKAAAKICRFCGHNFTFQKSEND